MVSPSHTIQFAGKKTIRIGLGTMPLGGDLFGPLAPDAARKVIAHALEMGIRLLDTAPMYGQGAAEEACGQEIANSRLRDEIIVVTKGGLQRDPQSKRWMRDASPTFLRRGLEESLHRLGLETIDLYQLHWPDPHTPVEETARALQSFQTEGLIRHVGLCNCSPATLREFMQYLPIQSHELSFSLFDPRLRTTALAASHAADIPVMAWGALAHGLLAHDPHTTKSFAETDFRRRHPWFQSDKLPAYQKACRALADWATKRDLTLAQLAIRYVLSEPGVTIALWGIHTPQQLSAIPSALEKPLPPAERQELESLARQFISYPEPAEEVPGPPSRSR